MNHMYFAEIFQRLP